MDNDFHWSLVEQQEDDSTRSTVDIYPLLVSRLLVLHGDLLAENVNLCHPTSLKYQQLIRIALRFDGSWMDGTWFQMVDTISERLESLPYSYYPDLYFALAGQNNKEMIAARKTLSEVLLSESSDDLKNRWYGFWNQEQSHCMTLEDFRSSGHDTFSWNFVQELIEAMIWAQPVLQPILDPK